MGRDTPERFCKIVARAAAKHSSGADGYAMLRAMHRFIVLAVLLVACKQDKGPPCAKVVDHMLDVTKQALPGHDSEGVRRSQGDGRPVREAQHAAPQCANA